MGGIAWIKEEDHLLKKVIQQYGEGKWQRVPVLAGLNRCPKSCRLRWVNYLRPNIRRGTFEEDEIDLIIRLHKLLGNRWSLIAGRLPGRTGNDVKNYWNCHLGKKLINAQGSIKEKQIITKVQVIKPQLRSNATTRVITPVAHSLRPGVNSSSTTPLQHVEVEQDHMYLEKMKGCQEHSFVDFDCEQVRASNGESSGKWDLVLR